MANTSIDGNIEGVSTIGYSARLAVTAPAALLPASLGAPAQAQGTLRVAMTASNVPIIIGGEGGERLSDACR